MQRLYGSASRRLRSICVTSSHTLANATVVARFAVGLRARLAASRAIQTQKAGPLRRACQIAERGSCPQPSAPWPITLSRSPRSHFAFAPLQTKHDTPATTENDFEHLFELLALTRCSAAQRSSTSSADYQPGSCTRGKLAPLWRPRLFLRPRSSRAVVPWKRPLLPHQPRPNRPANADPPILRRLLSPSSKTAQVLRHFSGYKASFLAGYRSTRRPLSPSPTLAYKTALRERLLRLRHEVLPRYRRRAHARVYRFLVERAARRRQEGQRQLTLRLLPIGLRNDAAQGRLRTSLRTSLASLAATKPDMSYDQEPGSRRRRLAAMANNVYRAGVAAASEIREQYNSSRARDDDAGDSADDRPPNIPGAFPDVKFSVGGDAQMVLFPMYAKRHVRKYKDDGRPATAGSDDSARSGESPDWRHEFAKLEDEKAVVDVNVHGWLYTVNKGPLTRKNRLLIGLARRLSGIPAPGQYAATATALGGDDMVQSPHEARKIQRAAEAIDRRGQGEKAAAQRGEYSEGPDQAASYDDSSSDDTLGRVHRPAPPPAPGPGNLTPRSSWTTTSTTSTTSTATTATTQAPPEMSEAEIVAANLNLMSRLGPFLTTPVANQPVTLFFYNEQQSQSRTVLTTDAGHFVTCAALDFVPTHVRILVASSAGSGGYGAPGYGESASEISLANSLTHPLSAVAPVELVEDAGISLISDIDDTVKRSNIALGTREIFRNTFVRELGEMTVEGAREWYAALHALGVQFHYCSNSPWQLFPVLTTFFRIAGLPRGPLHLKQYSGMLQGIFEPVAERKRGTLEKILRDFPSRRFLLVGDSGEADLEVYTELALAHPGRILAIFIRDVTTPEQPGFFDPSTEQRPALPPRTGSAPAPKQGPAMGTLIDLDDLDDTPAPTHAASADHVPTLPARKPMPPPRPNKPVALRGALSSGTPLTQNQTQNGPPPPPPRRKAVGSAGPAASDRSERMPTPPPPPPPPPPPRRTGTGSSSTAPYRTPVQTPAQSQAPGQGQMPVSKKVDLWHRRLAHAQNILGPHGVALYTWRRGQDVAVEAVAIVKRELGH